MTAEGLYRARAIQGSTREPVLLPGPETARRVRAGALLKPDLRTRLPTAPVAAIQAAPLRRLQAAAAVTVPLLPAAAVPVDQSLPAAAVRGDTADHPPLGADLPARPPEDTAVAEAAVPEVP